MGEELSPTSSPEQSPVPVKLQEVEAGGNQLLSNECSAFLRAHASDEIQWRPWGRDAIVEAAENDLPIFLSVGFFTSFWCKKQQEESYDRPEVAELINSKFVPVLADRDQYPDIDRMFSAASQVMCATTGGWPLHVMLTPELKPFFCAHFMKRKAFCTMACEMADMWASEGRTSLLYLADETSAQLLSSMEPSDVKVKLDVALFKGCINKVRTDFDEVSGGFGRPAKFPSVPRLRLLLRLQRRVTDEALKKILQTMVEGSLKGMCSGGLYDHLGGGFFRCSTDVRWQIPQFEKTLYDNALLAIINAEAAQAFKDSMYYDVVRETLLFMLSHLQAPTGGFYSALHSVTDGTEGSFYVWRSDELKALLSPDRLERLASCFDVTEWGNFENGTNHLRLTNAEEGWQMRTNDPVVSTALRDLRLAREKRVQPAADDKLVAGWNGLAICALAMGHRIFRGDNVGRQFLEGAQRAAKQVCSMFVDDRLMRLARGTTLGENEGMLEDYAYAVQGLLALYQEDFNTEWYEQAMKIQRAQDTHFSGLGKRYSLSPLQNSPLPPRQDYLDSDLPSAQGVAISNLLTLNALTQEAGDGPESESGKLLRHAEQLLLAVGDTVVKSPVAHAQYLMALDQYMDSQTVVVMAPGPLEKSNASEMLMKLGSSYYPHVVLAGSDVSSKGSGPSVLKDKDLFQGAAAVYVLGSEGNVEFNQLTSSGDMEAVLQNPSQIVFN